MHPKLRPKGEPNTSEPNCTDNHIDIARKINRMETEKQNTVNQAIIDDRNVPEAHKGLHSFLYSSDDEHTAAEVDTNTILESNNGEIVPLQAWCDRPENAKVTGVYAVLDSQQRTQYIGYARNVLLLLNGHVATLGTETCAFVRVQGFKFPKRQDMEALRDGWIQELNSIPPGNADDSGLWANSVGEVAAAAMTTAEREAYEEKKLKLRKAMNDRMLITESEKMDISDDQRRQQLEASVKDDDWSAVIQGQTQETKPSS